MFANIYYQRTFTGKKSLSINTLVNYYPSTFNNLLVCDSAMYSYNDNYDNKSFSVIAETLYSDKLWNGDLNVGVYYMFKNFSQKDISTLDKYTLRTQEEYVYADLTIFRRNTGTLGLLFNTALY